MSKVSALPTSRPVHPCVLSAFKATNGSEFSTWAHLTNPRSELPNLVSAQGSTLHVYSIDQDKGKLVLQELFSELSGNVCYLSALRSQGDDPDALLIGFAGHPRLSIVTLVEAPAGTVTSGSTMLLATTLLDLTQALIEESMGSVTPLEQDMAATMQQNHPNSASVSVVLGGGVGVACLTIKRVKAANGKYFWNANEPYILPLPQLHRSLEQVESGNGGFGFSSNTYHQSIAHGFGDIVAACFLPGYLEPTLVLLHANAHHGRAWTGRIGRPKGEGGTSFGLVATAISVSVGHNRSAILWSTEVTADAHQLTPVGKSGCLVLGVNTVLELSNSGRIMGALALNGWARSTCPFSLWDLLSPNPWPLPKLSIQLDGAKLAMLNQECGIVSLRRGDLYLLQKSTRSWAMLQLGRSLGAIGHVTNLVALPFEATPTTIVQKLLGPKASKKFLMGLLFAGSRLGDSSLLGYTLQANVTLIDVTGGKAKKRKVDEPRAPLVKEEEDVGQPDEDGIEAILRKEEEALYAPDPKSTPSENRPNIVPPSDEEDSVDDTQGMNWSQGGQTQLTRSYVLQSLTALDSITAVGALGPGCEGPVLAAAAKDDEQAAAAGEKRQVIGDSVKIFSCGYGSSGGLALLSTPGRDSRMILAEADCLNVSTIFSLPLHGIVLLAMAPTKTEKPRVSAMRFEKGRSESMEMSEIDVASWCRNDRDAHDILTQTMLLEAVEIDERSFILIVDSGEEEVLVVVLEEVDHVLSVVQKHDLVERRTEGQILSLSPIFNHDRMTISFGCVWESGCASVSTLGPEGLMRTHIIGGTASSSSPSEVKKEEEETEVFYACDRVTAIDIFSFPRTPFTQAESSSDEGVAAEHTTSGPDADKDEKEDWMDDDEYVEIYGAGPIEDRSSNEAPEATKREDSSPTVLVAVCRQSGLLEVYELSTFTESMGSHVPLWTAPGCAHGVSALAAGSNPRTPHMHNAFCAELRFFVCGPTDAAVPKQLYLALETSLGDIHIYRKDSKKQGLKREMLRLPTRSSKKQVEHQGKLRRKGILGSKASAALGSYRRNTLHRFSGISGEDGLFAASSRPIWFMTERGRFVTLYHRSRHVAPAGGKPRPITGFCTNLAVSSFWEI